jgi:hypothetical protein
MADEQLRMTAEVVDKFSKPLRDLQKALRDVKQPPAAREMREQFAGVSKAANEAAQSIRNGFGAAVGALGLTSLSAAGAIAAIVASVKGMSSATSELKAFSRETGLSTQRLRELEALGDRFQIAPDTVKSGVQTFTNQLYEIRRRYGETYGWLHATAPQFAEQLVGSKSVEEAVGRALGYLAKIEDPHKRQVFAEKLFGSGMFGRFGAEGLAKLQEQLADVRKSLGELPKGAEESAEKFDRSLKALGDTLRGIRDEFGAGLLPGFSKELESLRTEIAKPEFKAFVNDFALGLLKTTKEVIGTIKELKDGLTWFYDRSSNPVKKLTPEELKKANEEYYKPKIADLQHKLAELDALPEPEGGMWSASPKVVKGARDKQRVFLEDEIKRLERAMKEGVKDGLKEGGASIQPQSFDGTAIGGGARIWNASLGGGGFSLPRLQRGGGGSARDTDTSGPMLKWEVGRGGSAKAASRTSMMSYAMDQLRKEGVPEANLRAAAAHLVGQADMESGLDPNKSHDGGTGYGIYGARDPSPGRGRKTNMLRWLKENGYAANSAEGQMRYMAHEAMGKNYPTTRGILMNANPNAMGRDSRAVTHEFEAPKVDNDRSGAVGRAYKVGPDNSLSRMGDSLMKRGAGAQKIEGDASVNINLNGFPRGTKFSTESSGMFKDIKLNRGRQMPDAGEDI